MIVNNQVNKKVSWNGFTLIELLVVITIIMILASILLTQVGNIRGKAKLLACQTNLRKLYAGLMMYESEFKSYPRGTDCVGKEFWNYLRTQLSPLGVPVLNEKNRDELFVCPVRSGRPGAGVCHYRGPTSNYEVTDGLTGSDPIGADIVQNHDPKESKQPINVLYWGGTIISVDYNSTDWQQADSTLQE